LLVYYYAFAVNQFRASGGGLGPSGTASRTPCARLVTPFAALRKRLGP